MRSAARPRRGAAVRRWLVVVLLADLHVLVHPTAELDVRVPARGPVTVADLLQMTAGFGLRVDASPLAHAMGEQQVAPGPLPPALDPHTWLSRLGALPLVHSRQLLQLLGLEELLFVRFRDDDEDRVIDLERAVQELDDPHPRQVERAPPWRAEPGRREPRDLDLGGPAS